MSKVFQFRATELPKLEFENNLLLAKSGLYNNDHVQELIEKNDFYFLPSAKMRPKITNSDLMDMRCRILELKLNSERSATAGGKLSESQARAIFDQALFEEIHELFPITPYETSKPEVWEYITIRVLLDVAFWRFGENNFKERYLGLHRARHVFARWWFRRQIIDESEVSLAFELKETEWENVFERPILCWNPQVANAALRVLHETRNWESRVRGSNFEAESSDRTWIKRIRRVTSQHALDSFDESELFSLFLSLYPTQ